MNSSQELAAALSNSRSTFLLLICGLGCLVSAWSGGVNWVHAEEPAQEKITYDDHVRPIFRQYCLSCHSADTKQGDLAIDAFATTIEGGASGEVVAPGELESSRLWDLVSHQDEPTMPPNADKLPDDKLSLIRRWIEGGALENSGSVAKASKKPSLAMLEPASSGKPEGPPAMPESCFREPVVYSPRAGAVTALAASPWAPLVAVAGQRQISLYHAETANLIGVVPFLEGLPQVLAFSRDGSRLLAAGGRGAAVGLAAIYDVKTGSRLLTVGDEYDAVLAADMNAQQTLVALGGPLKVVRVFHAADNSLAFEIRKHTDWITAIAFSPNGKMLVTADRNGGAFLWEADTGREVASLRGHTGAITSASWRADSQVVATSGADGSIRLWDREEGKQVKSWTAHGGGATAVTCAADGRLVSTGRDRVVKLWKVDGGPLKNLTSFGDIGLATCMTHDGKRVAAGDFLGDVRLIDIESGQQVGMLAPNPPTLAMRVSHAAAELATVTQTLDTAAAAKREADKAMAAAQKEANRRANVLAETQRKLGEAEAERDEAANRVKARKQDAAAKAAQVTQTTTALVQASGAVTASEAELSQARNDKRDLAKAAAKLTAATERVKQTVAAIEAAQAALKTADEASHTADAELAAQDAAVTVAKQSVQTKQVAVDEFTQQIATLQTEVTAKAAEVANRQAAVAAAEQAQRAAQEEQRHFATATDRLAAAIGQATENATAQAQALAATVALKDQALTELEARKAVADEAAAKLAAAKQGYERLKVAMNEAQAVVDQKAQAAAEAELAHLRAEAAAAQAQADHQLFEKAQAVRAEYDK